MNKITATQDFNYVGVEVKAGQEVLPEAFDDEQLDSLLRLGWVSDGTPKPEPLAVEEEKQIDEPVKKVHRSKSK